ncbi:MAG: hypothetical protein DRJ67_11285, partial [Thermoprotei archaeon]
DVETVVGIDVADSDRISEVATMLANRASALIVPSRWSRDACLRSGVRVPVYVVPHGLDREWYEGKPEIHIFRDVLRLKEREGYKYLLFFCMHSPYRKGLDLVLDVYERVRRERKDIVLIAKLHSPNDISTQVIRALGGIMVYGWLTERQKRELYDVADIYLLFSRGGSFEMNGLEALARGLVVVAGERGPWTEYLPHDALLPTRRVERVLSWSMIHVGGGYEIDVERAVDRICEIADNLDEYKARVREHVNEYVKHRFNWDAVGQLLTQVLSKHIY